MTAPNIYRQTTLGNSLLKTLQSFIDDELLSPNLAETVLQIYDKAMLRAFSHLPRSRTEFKANKLRVYSHIDGVWTLVMDDVFIRGSYLPAHLDSLKVVALDANLVNTTLAITGGSK